MAASKKISDAASALGDTLKSVARIAFASRKGKSIDTATQTQPLVIMGNGPSLRDTIASHADTLRRFPTMAVNFAADTPEFKELKPEYYVLADPHFANTSAPGVRRLNESINGVSHHMTLLLPHGFDTSVFTGANLTIRHFPAVAVEGIRQARDAAIKGKIGMPRPRNVLVCAIMCGIWLGFREIYITGADHTWTRTLSVNERNEVVSIQPHFYSDSDDEKERVTSVYKNVRLHEILDSFRIAFKAYHDIADYAGRHGINIYNATPGSFIDAFERRRLP